MPKSNNRRLKSKWANKFTALTLRNSDIQLKKLQQNVETLLNIELHNKHLMEKLQTLAVYELQSPLLRTCGVREDQRILKNSINDEQQIELFFVKELFEVNQLPAGHLLKDWQAIQGRDLTPNPSNKQNIERAERLKSIYQDLEEHFCNVRKKLDWTSATDMHDDHEITCSKDLGQITEIAAKERSLEAPREVENEELNAMIELLENIERIDDCLNEPTEVNTMTSTTSTYDKKMWQLLPISKSLDAMHVSGCSSNTLATITTSQKNRSNSPDVFADSDVELEEMGKTTGN